MNKYISKLIVMAVLLIEVLTVVITDFSTPILVMSAMVLGVLAIVLFKGADTPFSSRIPWVMGVGILVFYVLPCGPIELENLERIPDLLGGLVAKIVEIDSPGIWSFGILILLQLFLREKANGVWIFLRYLAALVFFITVRNTVFYTSETYYYNLVITIVCMCFVRELIASINGIINPSMLRCVLIIVFCLMIHFVFGYSISDEIDKLFRMDSANWLRSTLLMMVLASLTLLDDYFRNTEQTEKIYRFSNCGWMMFFWCLLAVIMNVWTDFNHVMVLLAGYPVGCAVCSKLLVGFNNRKTESWSKVLFSCLTVVVLVLMMLAKSCNMHLLLRWTLIAMVILVLMSWQMILNGNIRRGILETGVGMSAIIMLVTMNLTSWEQFGENPGLIIGAALACAIWSMICSQQRKLEKQVSDIYPAEYELVSVMSKVISLSVLVIASMKVLFVL